MTYPLTGLRIPCATADDTELVELEEWQDFQKQVDGTFDIVTVGMTAPGSADPVLLDLYVNDEGLIWKLPINHRASMLSMRHIVGNCVLVGPATPSGEATDVPDWAKAIIDHRHNSWLLEMMT